MCRHLDFGIEIKQAWDEIDLNDNFSFSIVSF